MGLPTSGQLSLRDIQIEIGASTSNVSLGSMSDTAGFSAPDKITDFYGFSALKLFYVTNTNYRSSSSACGQKCTVSRWHDGTSALPQLGDTIYTNSTGTTTWSWSSWYGCVTTSGGSSIQSIAMSKTVGVVGTVGICLK